MQILKVVTFYLIYLIGCGSANVDGDALRKRQGKLMKSYMDFSVDPCDNFYKYACGKWPRFNRIEKNKYFSVPKLLSKKMKKFFHHVVLNENLAPVLNENLTNILKTDIVKKVRSYYSLCLREKRDNFEPYVKALGVPGGWPALNASWSKDEFNWINVTGHLKLFGIATLIDVVVAAHYEDKTQNSVYIQRPEFSIVRQNAFLSRYRNIQIAEIFEKFGLNDTAVEEITESIAKFETALEENNYSESDDDDPYVSFEMLSSIIPEIDWQEFLNIISGEEFNSSRKVVLRDRPYLRKLITLLNDTRSEVVANFLLYRFALSFPANLTTEESCTEEVITHLGSVLGSIYNLAFNSDEANADVEEIVMNMKSAFADSIRETDWLESATLIEALAKLEEMILKIGAPKDNTIEKFTELEFDPDDYYTNYLRLNAYTTRKQFQELNRKNSRTTWNYNPAEFNAAYYPYQNSILISNSIFQTPFYSPHFPNSIKYGGLGAIIGHELTHSLDTSGRKFDAKGNLRNWWTPKSLEEYTNRTKCLITQYDNYTSWMMKDLTSIENSTNTLGENIADNGGIRHAYRAYVTWLDENNNIKDLDKDEILPGLKLTNKQLFFLSFAQFYCESVKPFRSVVKSLLTDVHAPHKHRVIGTLTNFEEFSKEFQCPAGSKMNPEKKCKIW